MTVDDSLWFCQVRVENGAYIGPCMEQVRQDQMEDHLRHEHKRRLLSPGDVIPFFVLVRSSDLGRGPGRRGKIEDETMTMFEKGVDFR